VLVKKADTVKPNLQPMAQTKTKKMAISGNEKVNNGSESQKELHSSNRVTYRKRQF
jgi:hypothetical protein